MWAIFGKPSPLISKNHFLDVNCHTETRPIGATHEPTVHQHSVGHFENTVAQPAKSGGSHQLI
jgi:hypothetical protein